MQCLDLVLFVVEAVLRVAGDVHRGFLGAGAVAVVAVVDALAEVVVVGGDGVDVVAADVPALLHYFEMRMRLETGRQDLDPAVLAYVMLPAEPARRGIAVEKADAASWRVTPADPATTFLFPHKGYEFQQYPSDTLIEMPWGLVTLRGDNVAGELTALDVRPNSAAIEAWRERKWYAFDGEHLVALPREFARSNGDT